MIDRLILAAIVVGIGYFVWSDQRDQPSAFDRTMQQHKQLMERAGF